MTTLSPLSLSTLKYTPASTSGVKFAGLSGAFADLKAGLPTKEGLEVSSEFRPTREPLIQGSLKQGITRALKKTLLRPRGLVELALAIAPGHIGLVFIGKSFLEGLLGADSLIVPRKLGFKALGVSKQFDGRTIVGGIKNWITGAK